MKRLIIATAAVAWILFWLWAFTAGDISWFIGEDRARRLPFLGLALLTAYVVPAAGVGLLRSVLGRRRSPASAGVLYLLITGAPPLVYAAAFHLAARSRSPQGPLVFEADEAMGLLYMLAGCIALWLAGVVVVWSTLLGLVMMRRRRPQSP